ncbi:MAG: family 43 glycosylhydrolase [Actinomycetia bacterium]|nr:family 43 glycosylhydrolase [Actinomycetes bacterium]
MAPATTTTAQVPAVPTTGDYSLADVEAADPEVVFADGFHYLYATNVATPFGVFVHLPTWRSEDLMEWEWVGNTMPELGPWAEAGNTWAPGVIQVGDLWIAYYTARVAGTTADPAFPAGEQCIGTAVADSPEGPFVDSSDAPLVCQHELGGSIDASPYRDADGSLWLTYKSDSNAPHVGGTARLFSQQLSSDGLELVGSPNQLVVADQAWEMPLIENPDFVRGPDGNLWLSYSAAWWGDSSYKTGLAQCDSPAGGCTKGGPWISTDAALTGPGGLSFFDHDGVTVAALHSWNAGVTFDEGGFRQLAVASVDWS